MRARQLESVLTLVLVFVVVGCDGDDGGGTGGHGGADPRCERLCEIDMPALEGAYDVCSDESAQDCLEVCAVQIADTTGLCRSCLLEDAQFPAGSGGGGGSGTFGGSERTVTIQGPGGTCTYTAGDEAEEEACIRQVHPRRIVECEVEFRPVSECQAICAD
jgi:hypothetical protein